MTTAPCGCVLPRGPFCADHRREFFGEAQHTDADRFLILIRDNPTLLPAAAVDSTAAMEHRRRDEVHTCLRCGGRAQCAMVAGTSLGSRWLDLCAGCYSWLVREATPAPLWPGR
jgi:formate dehydrogenase maturation protein FdhE